MEIIEVLLNMETNNRIKRRQTFKTDLTFHVFLCIILKVYLFFFNYVRYHVVLQTPYDYS
jgi:hypothetical protein